MTAIFQRDFDREAEQEARTRAGRLTEAELDAIRSAAFAEGERKGRLEAEERMRGAAETLRAESLRELRDGLVTLLSGREAHERALETHLVDYAIAVGEKVLPELISTRAHQHVIAQIRRGLRMGLGSGRVLIRLSPEDRAILGPDLDRMIADAGPEGRVCVEVSGAVRPGDLSVTWDRGGLDYSLTAICEDILTLLRNSKPTEDVRAGNTTRRGTA